jgi:hypothetical protein
MTDFVYYTSVAEMFLMHIKVDPESMEPSSDPELGVAGHGDNS